jgi:hypothetical protein
VAQPVNSISQLVPPLQAYGDTTVVVRDGDTVAGGTAGLTSTNSLAGNAAKVTAAPALDEQSHVRHDSGPPLQLRDAQQGQ